MSGKKRFEVSVAETIYHHVEVELEDAEGDAAAGYPTNELVEAARAAMRGAGHDYHIDSDDIGGITEL